VIYQWQDTGYSRAVALEKLYHLLPYPGLVGPESCICILGIPYLKFPVKDALAAMDMRILAAAIRA
jgi:hypothetical protein